MGGRTAAGAAHRRRRGFTSGYTSFGLCRRGQTVGECAAYRGLRKQHDLQTAEHIGRFFYSGAHMQQHAARMGLGGDGNEALAQHVAQGLQGVMTLSYGQPQLAGGVQTSAAEYGRFLQNVVSDGCASARCWARMRCAPTRPLEDRPAVQSLPCGRVLRAAWADGRAR